MAIDATRDASPLLLLQTIDWSIKIDALVVKSRALSTSIAVRPCGRRAACWPARSRRATTLGSGFWGCWFVF